MRTVTIEVERIERETDLAFLVRVDDSEVWIPKSLIDEADSFSEGDESVEIEVAEWFAEREGLA